VRSVTQWLLRAMSGAARPYVSAYGLLQTTKVFNRSALVWTPGDERVVVLAPHMDDEVIGCGGTLARHVASGADVTVIFLTDGRKGGTPSAEDRAQGLPMSTIRKREAQRALAVLGIEKIEFLDAEDGHLGADARTSGRLRELLLRIRPQLLYLPFFLEQHSDHEAASPLLAEAVQGTDLEFRCLSYEVWTPLFPNCFVRIDATLDLKRRALEQYRSQLADADYLHTSLGLSAYRSSAFLDRDCRFAEAFCVLSLRQYLEFYRSMTHADATPGPASA
jgi:LmbE family N-acetylglucosaminyl deacetylase